MGFFDWFRSRSTSARRSAEAARSQERAGDLAAAVELYEQAGLADETARVLLLRADVEPSPERRIAFCAAAARIAEAPAWKRQARSRKALIAFDLLRGHGAKPLQSEVLLVARDLEEAGELLRAAEAYVLAGDGDAEVRVLTAAGAIDLLEARLRESERIGRGDRELATALATIADLDRTAERRAALHAAGSFLATRDEPGVADLARTIRARLPRGPVVDLEVGGNVHRYALGSDVTIGRGEATIVVASRALSRAHLRLWRDGTGQALVEDLGTRNGTRLAGARLSAPIPVGSGLRLDLDGDVPCVIAPAAGGFSIEVAGDSFVAPLGPVAVGPWQVLWEPGALFVVLCTPEGAPPPFLGAYQLARRVELCHGDEIRPGRGENVLLRVPPPGGAVPVAPAERRRVCAQ